MSVQILTYDNKVVTVNTGTETKVLAAGTIPQDASDWVEKLYANFPTPNPNSLWTKISCTWTTGTTFAESNFCYAVFSHAGSTVWREVSSHTGSGSSSVLIEQRFPVFLFGGWTETGGTTSVNKYKAVTLSLSSDGTTWSWAEVSNGTVLYASYYNMDNH